MDRRRFSGMVLASLLSKAPLAYDGSEIPAGLVDFMRINKVLYPVGLYDTRIRNLHAWRGHNERKQQQIEATIALLDIANRNAIDILVVKSFGPFENVPDDVDILIMKDRHLATLVAELTGHGFFLRRTGTSETTLRKIVGGTYVDLDLHVKIAAGTYEYIGKEYLWNGCRQIQLHKTPVPVPSIADELLVRAAHAIMKEFSITLADVMHVLSCPTLINDELEQRAREVGLLTPLLTLVAIARKATRNTSTCDHMTSFPTKVNIVTTLLSYAENLRHRTGVYGLRPLIELAKTPSSKGAAVLLRYFGL